MKDYTRFEDFSDKICYIPEAEDRAYNYNDFLSIALGNQKLAQNLFDIVEWQHPETLFEEWVMEGEIDEFGNKLNKD